MTTVMKPGATTSPTFNEEAEASVLGAVLLSPVDGATEAIDLLRPEDFYHPAHQAVYEAVVTLYDSNVPIDPVTVSNRLRATEELARVGGIQFITGLLDAVPTASNLPYYASLVRTASLRRRLITAVARIQGLAGEPDREIVDVLDEAEQTIFEVGERHDSRRPEGLSSALSEAIEGLELAHSGGLPGVPTGYKDVDRLLSGLKPGNLAVLAARPSMGKSSWALGAAHHVAKTGVPVAFFSLEMTRAELAARLMCADARVDSASAQSGDLDSDGWSQLLAAANRLSELPLYIEDKGLLSVTTMRARARRIARAATGLGLIVVDYMQLMEGRGENRQQEIAGISRGLKQLARDLDVPVLALSQLNRAVEARENKRPRLADLRDSGSIEQDADVVLFLYREEYYSPTSAESRGKSELEVAKHRTGRTGSVTQTFIAEYASFEDAAW